MRHESDTRERPRPGDYMATRDKSSSICLRDHKQYIGDGVADNCRAECPFTLDNPHRPGYRVDRRGEQE